MTPAELMRAILLAPVDLLWNGGIGTYVKASAETHADAGDKANDAIRVDGEDLRCHCVGEGGNLGLTQLGRIEYARRGRGGEGGRINTDFIDNSAGVDTSDHEVNIKILLDRVVAAGDLTGKQRNALLAEMTDEVAELVLRDNYEQNLALANAAANAHRPAARARVLDEEARGRRRAQPRARGSPVDAGGTPAARPRPGPERPGAVGAAGLDQDRAGRGAAGLRAARRPVPPPRPDGLLPGPGPRGASSSRSASTRCGARSS